MVSTKALIESSLLTAIAVVLILISIYVPIFYFIGLFMWPLPLALVQIKHGYKYSFISLITTTIITFIFTDPYTAFGFAISNGVLGIALGIMIKRKEKAINTIFIMIIVNVISVAISIKIFGLIAGQDYIKIAIDEFYKSIDKSVEMAKSFYERMGVQREVYENTLILFPQKEMLLMLIPFALFMYGFLSAITTYVMAKGIYSRFGIKLEEIPKFSNWYVPVKLAFSIIIIVLISYVLAYFKIRNADAYLLNAMYLMLFVFSINGLAALSFWLDKQNLPKGFKIFILLFAFFSLGNILFLVGIVDYSLNLRKLDKSRLKDSPK